MVTREEDYRALMSQLMALHAAERKELNKILVARLLVFFATIAGIWLTYPEYWLIPGFVGISGVAFFLILVKRNENLKFSHLFTTQRIELTQHELNALTGDISSFGNGEGYTSLDHPYAYDLDILGDRSFFQSINRTGTRQGEMLLADWALDNEPMDDDIMGRQLALQELAEKVEFRQNFCVYGRIYASSEREESMLNKWFTTLRSRISVSVFWNIYRYLIPVVSFGALALFLSGFLQTSHFITYCLLPLGITGAMLKHTNAVYLNADERFKVLSKAGKLLRMIENEEVISDVLQKRKEALRKSGWSSADIQSLDKIINAFDSRQNPFVGIILNVFLAWDFQCLYRLEKWVEAHLDRKDVLFNELAWWDAMSSLGTYAYNHPDYIYPELGDHVIRASDLGHPFIDESKCVRNSFGIDTLGEFKIITGANMAGKSTFLRTVGLSLIMGRIGLPVFASAFSFKPVKLYTSMRTTDSLQENESYFYTELKRLKGLVKRLDEGEELFIILDEILKGTNSRDKAEGSQRFIEKLLKYPVAGIIATHDLSLTTLGDKFEAVENICFEVEFGTEDLIFDYKLKPGVCKNMNATWLLEKMKLV